MTGAGGSRGRDRLRYDCVSKQYAPARRAQGGAAALTELSLSIGPGESVGIIGPNGAGKSTMLKLAAGVTAPTAGKIGRSRRTSAVIELGAGIHPDLTGRENVDLLTALVGEHRVRSAEAFDRIVAFAQLGEVLDRPARHYSSGMLARLAFSVAVHSEPELLLLDEVLSVGDLSFQQRCRQRIADLRSEGTTVVVVSHDLSLITEVCERAVLLVGGRKLSDGDAYSVVAQYLGRPVPARSANELAVGLAEPDLGPGQPLDVDVEIPSDVAHECLRADIVVPTHPGVQAEGQGLSIVCGSARVVQPSSGRVRIRLTTQGLPRGRYELHLGLEDASGRTLRRSVSEFRLGGPTGPNAIRLSSRVTLDGAGLPALR